MVEKPSLGVNCQAWTQRSAGLRDTSSAKTVEEGKQTRKERRKASKEKTETERDEDKGNKRKGEYSWR